MNTGPGLFLYKIGQTLHYISLGSCNPPVVCCELAPYPSISTLHLFFFIECHRSPPFYPGSSSSCPNLSPAVSCVYVSCLPFVASVPLKFCHCDLYHTPAAPQRLYNAAGVTSLRSWILSVSTSSTIDLLQVFGFVSISNLNS